MKKIMELPYLLDLATGRRVLSKMEFSEVILDDGVFGPTRDFEGQVVLEDLVFKNCTVASRFFAIEAGVSVRNVEFLNVASSESLTISTNALLEHLVLSGHFDSGGIWVRPDEIFDSEEDSRLKKWVETNSMGLDWMLDISGYDAPHVEILGLPIDKVKFNSLAHVIIKKEDGIDIDWKKLGVPGHSFIRICLLRLETFEVPIGIFGLPQGEERQRAIEEIDLVRNSRKI